MPSLNKKESFTKKFLVLAIAIVCLASGCTKKYDSVEEYANSMKEVKHKNSCYTIKGTYETWNIIFNFTTYKKENKWKTEIINNNAQFVYLYDGSDVYLYNNKYIVKNPINDYAKKHDIKTINGQNPTNIVYDWYMDEYSDIAPNPINMTFAGNKKFGKYDCRLLVGKYGQTKSKVCVNDKSGIAVSTDIKQTTPNGTLSLNINVTDINNSNIRNDIFTYPKNLKEISAEAFYQQK